MTARFKKLTQDLVDEGAIITYEIVGALTIARVALPPSPPMQLAPNVIALRSTTIEATAVCNPKDEFDGALGMEIALGRAHKAALPPRRRRTPIVEAMEAGPMSAAVGGGMNLRPPSTGGVMVGRGAPTERALRVRCLACGHERGWHAPNDGPCEQGPPCECPGFAS